MICIKVSVPGLSAQSRHDKAHPDSFVPGFHLILPRGMSSLW